MSSLLSENEKNEDESNLIYDANTDSDGESSSASNDDSIYLGLIIFGSAVFALGKMSTQLKLAHFLFYFSIYPTLFFLIIVL